VYGQCSKALPLCGYLVYVLLAPGEKLQFEMEVALLSSCSWVTVPSHLCMWTGGMYAPSSWATCACGLEVCTLLPLGPLSPAICACGLKVCTLLPLGPLVHVGWRYVRSFLLGHCSQRRLLPPGFLCGLEAIRPYCAGRQFVVEVEPRGLESGAHYAEVCTYIMLIWFPRTCLIPGCV
jgi:hypothetical protein